MICVLVGAPANSFPPAPSILLRPFLPLFLWSFTLKVSCDCAIALALTLILSSLVLHVYAALLMNKDYALLLNTVLSESGCMDASLQHTAESVPLVYRALAEHNFYALYVVSVVKALLHDHDAAFAYLTREQAQRQQRAGKAVSISAPAPPDARAAASTIPPFAPSDCLDMHLTVIGGGTCCELMLQLICGRGRTGGVGGGGIISNAATRDPLVHPSHITVVTRQPERLAPYAELGVHCITRHHGQQAVALSDVVALAFPPAKLREVTRDLFFSSAIDPSTNACLAQDTAAAVSSSSPTDCPQSILRPNAVLLSCMAGVPARKVADAFQHSSLSLIFIPSLYIFGGHPSKATMSCDDDDAAPSTVARSSALPGTRKLSAPSDVPRECSYCAETVKEHALEESAKSFTDAMTEYRRARIAEMRISTSFLRPAVLQQAVASAADGAAEANRKPFFRTQHLPGGSASPTGAVQPQLIGFTAGRDPSTRPTLAEYLDLWRTLKAYVQTTFAEVMGKIARARSSAGGDPRQSHDNVATGSRYGGLVSILLPHTSLKNENTSGPGEVEAELLSALVLLPAEQTRVLWDAWWGNNGRSSRSGEVPAASSLPVSVTNVTGLWLCRVYTTAASLKADLDIQFTHVLSARTQ